MDLNCVICGDALDKLRELPDSSVDLTFTSPPYFNAKSYAHWPTYASYLDFMEQVFNEIGRVTKEGRFFVLNTSPILIPRASRQFQSTRYAIPFDLHARLIGWDFIEDIIWLKPEASAKARVNSFAQHCQPLAYKPNAVTEYVTVYRKHTERLIDWNLDQYSSETLDASLVPDGYERTNVWAIPPAQHPLHPAIFPVELAERVIRYWSMVGDLVLDPFAGIGTVGSAARNLKRNFYLIELNTKYAQIAAGRSAERAEQLQLNL